MGAGTRSSEQPVVIECADGYALQGRVFEPSGERRRDATVIVTTALFVPQQFYFRFAAHLAAQGFRAVTFDDRGAGESLAAEGRPWGHRLRDWGERDLPAVIGHAHTSRPEDRLFVVGHSMGGQLLGLSRHTRRLDGIVTVAATAAYWGHWQSPERFGILAWYSLVPFIGRGLRTFPAEGLGLGTDVATPLVRDWAAWGRHRDYIYGEPFALHPHMESYRGRVLAYSFTDDRYLGWRRPVDELHRHFEGAEVTYRHLSPAEAGAKRVGHFGYFRPRSGQGLWAETIEWMEGGSASPSTEDEDEGEQQER